MIGACCVLQPDPRLRTDHFDNDAPAWAMSLLQAPRRCSTRTRTDVLYVLPCWSRDQRLCCGRPLRWIRHRMSFSFMRRVDIRRAVSAVRPHTQCRVVPIQDIVE